MGSRNTPDRKRKDSPIIRTPKTFLTATETGIPVKPSKQDQIADLCKLSFQVPIKVSDITKPGVPTNLEKAGSTFYIVVLGTRISQLPPKLSEMVDICNKLGVRYSGELVTVKQRVYARFTRTIQ